MMKLQVWNHKAHVGTLSLNDEGRWQFAYDPTWTSFALSPHLPVGTTAQDLVHQRTVEWFFDNLLPEGVLREKLAARNTIGKEDSWGLLSRYGKDTAGALSILQDGLTPNDQAAYSPLSIEHLAHMIDLSREGVPLMVQEDNPRMSLAGAQEKIALHLDEAGNFFMPEGTAPSTIILKPENTNKKYPFAPANEWFCMTLARLSGLKAPLANILSMGPHRVYVVKRYDRELNVNSNVNGVRRLHQIDLCQAMNVPPHRKYEDAAGLSAKDLFSVSAKCRVPAVANSIALRWLAFNYLIGNDDAHAKNISFMMATQKPEIAPAYDLLCVDAYHQQRRLTMGIGGQSQAGWVEGCHWDALALENRLDPRAIRTILVKLVAEVRKTKEMILSSTVLQPAERAWLTVNVASVLTERLAFVDAALAQPTCNAKTILEKHGLISEDILDNIATFEAHGEKEDG